MPSVSIYKPTVVSKGVKRKAGIWWMAWRCPKTRVQTRKSTGAREKSVARMIAQEQERRLLLDPLGISPQLNPNKSWSKFVREFLAHFKSNEQFGTENTYAISLNHLTNDAKPSSLADISFATLKDFVKHRREGGVKPATVNKDLRAIRSALKWGEQSGFIKCPSFKGLFIREDRKAPVVVPSTHFRAMLAAVEIPDIGLKVRSAAWWKVCLLILHGLGLRRGEALGLTWEVLDFDNKLITVKAETSKGRRDRQLPVGDCLICILRTWYEGHNPVPMPSDKILPWDKQTTRQFYTDWEVIIKAACLPEGAKYVPKNYRSTCGSEMIQNGTPSMVVKDFLGHSTVTTTEKFYVNTSQSLRAAVDRREKRQAFE